MMLPTSRVKRTRPPLAETSMFSLCVGAEEEHLVVAGLALDDVAAVAWVPLEDVVAGAQERDVVALVAVDEVVAVAAEQHVRALAAEDRVVARAAVDRQFDDACRQRGRGHPVVAAKGVDRQASRWPLRSW